MSPAPIAGSLAGLALALACTVAAAQSPVTSFPPAQIRKGAGIYARHCAPCHGPRMADPQGALNLRAFPRDQKNRFVASVTKGKQNMPPWGDLLLSDDVEALWAYVVAGEP